MSITETATKSQVLYRGYLPGGLFRLKNQCCVKVCGVRNDEEGSRQIHTNQLFSVAKQFIDAWAEFPNARVSALLQHHIDEPEANIRVVTPEAIYVSPFPLMLKCTTCNAIDFYQGRKEESDRIREMKRRIFKTSRGRTRISCPRTKDCNGFMIQVPYTSVHRCGSLEPLIVSQAMRGIAHVGFKDLGSSFIENKFFDADNPNNVARNALQPPCMICKNEFEDADGGNRRASPVRNTEQLFAKNIHYLSMSREMGEVMTNAGIIIGVSGLSPQGLSIAQGLFSCLIGEGTAEQLVEHVRNVPSMDDTSQDHIDELKKERTAQESLKSMLIEQNKATMDESTIAMLTKTFEDKITKLSEEISLAEGRFSTVANLLGPGQDDVFRELSGNRRAFESAILPYDCASSRKNMKDIEDNTTGPRKEKIQKDRSDLIDKYHVKEVAHYSDISVVMGSLGFTRERRDAPEGIPGGVVPTVLNGYIDNSGESTGAKSSIYALRAKTEAIEVKLCPMAVLKWCVAGAGWKDPGTDITGSAQKSMAYLLEHSHALRMEPVKVMSETKKLPHRESAPFHLLHSIAHCLIGTMKRHTGYDPMSISEYLLPMNLSILMYVSSVQNYTSGGLSMLMNHYLMQWFDDANNYALSCVFDPICSDKGSSCSGCAQVVLGCETFNYGLSRCYIHGGKLAEDTGMTVDKGFWE